MTASSHHPESASIADKASANHAAISNQSPEWMITMAFHETVRAYRKSVMKMETARTLFRQLADLDAVHADVYFYLGLMMPISFFQMTTEKRMIELGKKDSPYQLGYKCFVTGISEYLPYMVTTLTEDEQRAVIRTFSNAIFYKPKATDNTTADDYIGKAEEAEKKYNWKDIVYNYYRAFSLSQSEMDLYFLVSRKHKTPWLLRHIYEFSDQLFSKPSEEKIHETLLVQSIQLFPLAAELHRRLAFLTVEKKKVETKDTFQAWIWLLTNKEGLIPFLTKTLNEEDNLNVYATLWHCLVGLIAVYSSDAHEKIIQNVCLMYKEKIKNKKMFQQAYDEMPFLKIKKNLKDGLEFIFKTSFEKIFEFEKAPDNKDEKSAPKLPSDHPAAANTAAAAIDGAAPIEEYISTHANLFQNNKGANVPAGTVPPDVKFKQTRK